MRNWKNWLFPLLTAGMVIALALLPLRLSVLRDEELTGTIHTENLAEDSNFPAQSPPLARRLELLAQYMDLPDDLTIIGQELEAETLEGTVEQLRGELEALVESGVLPGNPITDDTVLSGSQIYLRDQEDLSSAGFLNLGGYDKAPGEYRSLLVDRETGFLAAMDVNGVSALKSAPVDAAALGRALLDRMGLAYQLLESSSSTASFRLEDVPVDFFVTVHAGALYVRPQIDWESEDLDRNQAAAIGIETDG